MYGDGYTDFTGLRVNGVPILPTDLPWPVGKVYWLDAYYGADSMDGSSAARAWATLDHAYGVMKPRDVLLVVSYGDSASGFVTIPSAVSTNGLVPVANAGAVWNINQTAIIGVVAPGQMSPRASFVLASGDNTSTLLFTLQASACYVINMGFFIGNTYAGNQRCLSVTGNHNVFVNCEAKGAGSTQGAANASSYSLSISGNENRWFGGRIGFDTIPRTAAMAEIVCSNAAQGNEFIGATIRSLGGGSGTNLYLKIGSAGIAQRLLFKNCEFENPATHAGGVAMAQGVSLTTPGGDVIFKNSQAQGVTKLETTSSGYLWVPGVGGAATGGLMVVNTG